MSDRPWRLRAVLLVVAALALTAAGSAYAATSIFGTAALDQPVVRTVLAQAVDPRGAPGQTLALSRVTVGPGAELALHRHPGTQIAMIERGTLTYWVVRGAIEVRRGDPSTPSGSTLVRTIEPGQRASIRTGEWIVEAPGTIHHAANRGSVQISIAIATLFKDGAPPAIPVRPSRP